MFWPSPSLFCFPFPLFLPALGQIEHEKLNTQLLDIQHDHAKKEASVAGLTEATRRRDEEEVEEEEEEEEEGRLRGVIGTVGKGVSHCGVLALRA